MLNQSSKIKYIILFVLMFTGILYVFLPNFFIKELSITYPFDGSLFPPEIIPPTFRWNDENSGADSWRIKIEFIDDNDPLIFDSKTMEWTPKKEIWGTIKKRSVEKEATVTIKGVKKSFIGKILSRNKVISENSIMISTSVDSVGAPIFYRDVVLPFEFARMRMDLIKWRLGDISKTENPPVIFEKLPLCGNCHSFTRDGSKLAMDVDFGDDKGSYAISPIDEHIYLSRDKLISWNDFRPEDEDNTFGFLAQISPRGRYVAAQVKDRVVSFTRDDLWISQLFYPVRGIIAIYNTETKDIFALHGADNFEEYVQANPNWSPDEKYITFARSPLCEFIKKDKTKNLVLTRRQTAIVLGGEEYLENPWEGKASYKFNLYRVPFNDGKGGKPEPIKGASHNGMSNYFPKYSPDGKWLVFCKAENYMLLQPDSKLYIMPADLSEEPRLMNCNMNRLNSWHSWSPNSRWLVFSSKVNSPYTELFLTHIDEEGNDTPPILLSKFSSTDRACNIPEFVNIEQDGIKQMHGTFVDYYSYVRQGANLVSFEKFEEAVVAYKESIEMNPNYAIAHRSLAEVLLRLDRLDEAEKEFEIALKLDQKDPAVHQNLGSIYMNRGEYDKAQKAFETALKLDSNHAPAIEGMGILLYMKGDYGKAKEKLITALNINSELTNASFNLGKLYMMDKEYDKAEKAFETVVKNESDSEAYIRLGTIHFIKNNYDEAKEDFEMALEIDPDNVGALQNLGIIYMQRKELDKAEKAFLKVFQKDPNNPSVCFLLGKLLSMNNRTIPDAIKMYDKALSLMPSNVQGYIDLGNLFLRIGRKEAAINEFEKALKLNPDAHELKAQIDKLKQQ